MDTYRSLLREARSALGSGRAAGLDAIELLAAAVGVGRAKLMSMLGDSADCGAAARYRAMLRRRLAHEPVQYICGEWGFMGLPFRVGPGVLIPRADTECLAEQAALAAKALLAESALAESRLPSIRILDLCTGSGCLAVFLARAIPGASVSATDASSEALAFARENAERNGVGGRVAFSCGDLFGALPVEPAVMFDMIVANPPYIPTQGIGSLPEDVRLYEPRCALDGGTDGLVFYRCIAKGSRRFLSGRLCGGMPSCKRLCEAPSAPSGTPLDSPSGTNSNTPPGEARRLRPQVLVEVGEGQARQVAEIFSDSGFALVSAARDLGGVERVLSFSPVQP